MCFAGIEDEIRNLPARPERPKKKPEADVLEPPTMRLPHLPEPGPLPPLPIRQPQAA